MPPTDLIDSPPPKRPWYRGRRVITVGIIMAVFALIALIVLIIMTAIWNSRPEKTLFDSLDYALNEPGSYNITTTEMTAEVDVDTKQRMRINASIDSVPLEAVVDANMLYLKTSDPAGLLGDISQNESLQQLAPILGRLVATVKDKWLSVNLQSQTLPLPIFKQVGCFASGKDRLANDGAAWRDFQMAYAANPFINIQKTGEKSDQVTYDLTVDGKKRQEFRDALQKGSAKSVMTECEDIQIGLLKQPEGGKITAKIDRPDNRFNELVVTDSSGAVTKITADYSVRPIVTAPQGAVEIESIIKQVLSSMMQTFKGR